jgi:hypothetical protein
MYLWFSKGLRRKNVHFRKTHVSPCICLFLKDLSRFHRARGDAQEHRFVVISHAAARSFLAWNFDLSVDLAFGQTASPRDLFDRVHAPQPGLLERCNLFRNSHFHGRRRAQ